jgi:hypothetical protein
MLMTTMGRVVAKTGENLEVGEETSHKAMQRVREATES